MITLITLWCVSISAPEGVKYNKDYRNCQGQSYKAFKTMKDCELEKSKQYDEISSVDMKTKIVTVRRLYSNVICAELDKESSIVRTYKMKEILK